MKVRKITEYVADDGKVFADKAECKLYEALVAIVDREGYRGMDKDDVVEMLMANRDDILKALK
jgi:hypothetical protein